MEGHNPTVSRAPLGKRVKKSAKTVRTEQKQLLDALQAAARGDFSIRLPLNGGGVPGDIALAFNTMVTRNALLASEMERVARVVGREGRVSERISLGAKVEGQWATSTGAVNALIGDLLQPTTEVARVISAVAKGDLTQKMGLEIEGQLVKGEFLRISTTVNSMVDQLGSFAAEVTRVAKEVGTDGKLGGQAAVPGAAGIWRDLTDNVNQLANNLTAQVRNIAAVTTSVAKGDLSKKITVDAKGEVLELKNTVNTMVDQLNSFASEVTRVAKEVGTDGKLGGQAGAPDAAGIWRDLTDNVNQLANNLTAQVRNIAAVTTSVAQGDLSKKITVDAKGEVLELKNTVNTMVDQLNSFASEVTRVAREVGTEGKLGGQADVKGVSGTWKDLTDNVNFMASNLTAQVRNIADVTASVAKGDLSRKVTVDVKGEVLGLKNTINAMVDQLNSFASEVTRVAKEVGTEGKLGGQAEVKGVAGTWKDLTDNVNFMASNLTTQVRGLAKVVTAVANGDLTEALKGDAKGASDPSQKITVEARGEVLELKNTINTMVDQLRSFASEVTRVAREVGTEGKLGGQARVPRVAGTWKDLTDNVNFMASNLTTQVRGIVRVVTAVANGDLSQKLTGVEAQGEIAALADTINNMCDTLGTFSDQVTTVAREVGIEGKLGGQAKVPGARGTWRQLTDNVNQLAGNLTSQVRAISEVATAVTKGDLTRSIDVHAEGEVALLKNNLNQMIVNLKETTQKNVEQDWLKTNLAKFASMMQGQKDLGTVSEMIMSQLTPLVSAHHGAFFVMDNEAKSPTLTLVSSYAYRERKSVARAFKMGEGIIGQCAKEKKTILLTKVPPNYIQISSGLGEATPYNIIALPVLFEGEVKAVLEFASFHAFSVIHALFLDQLTESIGVVLNMITANMRTEGLLLQSQNLTQELQSQSTELTSQQGELKRTNVALERQALELEEKARLLVEQNTKVEVKNREVEQARIAVEEKAEQLARISKYKSEFLANMSHELRTPLNSLLILAKLLTENTNANLTPKQVEYARTIYASGGDLLALINEILDLSKVEAGKMPVEPRVVALQDVQDFVERSFRPVAEQTKLAFETTIDQRLPSSLRTDPQRLQQVLKNLLSNAFKFTEHGRVWLRVEFAKTDVAFANETLRAAKSVLAFVVGDTGIGIAINKQGIIFEAFQQADGTTSRRYGGTGLGLSISREIARLLGGEIHVTSSPGKGSTFTLYLPDRYVAVEEVSTRKSTPEARPLPAVEDDFADDRESIREGDRVVLIIEDDEKFARILVDVAGEKGLKAVVARRGDTGIAMANELMPDAIILDVQLPVIDGLTVLARLKRSTRTRHIPVHVMAITPRNDFETAKGAFAYLEKPISKDALEHAFDSLVRYLDRKTRDVLIAESDDKRTLELPLGLGVHVTSVRNAEEAIRVLQSRHFDCAVLNLALPDEDVFHLAEEIKTTQRSRGLPLIIHTGNNLSVSDQRRVKKCAESVIVRGSTDASNRMLLDVALFLHRKASELPKSTQVMIGVKERAVLMAGRKVLVVDDDVRNLFAMSSVLEGIGLEVLYAENGRRAIDTLKTAANVDVVLMDIMMPEMDGYEAIHIIRTDSSYRSVPIIAVTAKALKEDRDKCINAGASDYLAKPIDANKLLDLIGVWLQ